MGDCKQDVQFQVQFHEIVFSACRPVADEKITEITGFVSLLDWGGVGVCGVGGGRWGGGGGGMS